MNFKRILLKLSGEALGGESGEGLSPFFLNTLSQEIVAVASAGIEIGIVIGGGNFFRGVKAEQSGMERTTADHIGMMATIINSLALKDMLEKNGAKAIVFSALNVPQVCESFTIAAARKYISKGIICIFAGGLGEPFFTTDTAAALRAIEIKANVLLKATKVDGIYDKDPVKYSDAIMFNEISFSDALNRKLKVMDQTAFALCSTNKMPIIVFNLHDTKNIKRIISGERVGTIVKEVVNA
jgi:uridylate kinase